MSDPIKIKNLDELAAAIEATAKEARSQFGGMINDAFLADAIAIIARRVAALERSNSPTPVAVQKAGLSDDK